MTRVAIGQCPQGLELSFTFILPSLAQRLVFMTPVGRLASLPANLYTDGRK